MKSYIIRKQFDLIDVSDYPNEGDVLICIEPNDVAFQPKNHFHGADILSANWVALEMTLDFPNIIKTDWDLKTLCDYLSGIGYKLTHKILVECEESQTVCKAFRELGFEAFSCDLQECSGGKPEWHILGDAVKEAYSGKYTLAIGHPPCDFMSKAGARWMHPGGLPNVDKERFNKAMDAKELFLNLLNAPIPFIAIENPRPLKIVGLPLHTQEIQPYQFGHPFSKATRLWLKNLPPLKPTEILKEYAPFLPSNTGGGKRGQKATFRSISKIDSSKTFQNIANEMANQWRFCLEN